MVKLRLIEEWARRVVEVHLGRPVDAHDDNSADGMFDLRVGPPQAPEIAIEVTGAFDEPYMSTWAEAQKRTGRLAGVVGDWTIVVSPGARINAIQRELAAVLAAVRATGRDKLYETDWLYEPELGSLFGRLRIKAVHCLDQAGDGWVHFTPGSIGGAVDSAGESVAAWVGAFLLDTEQADVLRKLERTTAPRREVFVVADNLGAPWGVLSYLTDISGRAAPVPPEAPVLPPPVTGLWLASTYSFGNARGVRWDGAEWSTFRSRGVGIDDEAPN